MLTFKNIDFPNYKNSLNYKDSLFLIGSCFAENINASLISDHFKTFANPFGICFNPKSIATILHRVLDKDYYNESDFFFHDNYYWCFEHHGLHAQINLNDYIKSSNETIDFAHDYLKKCSVLSITFGTNYVYAFGNKVVANCHKQPSNTFNSFNLSIDDITNDYDILIQKLKVINPSIQIIFTVSPVRYISQGIVANNLSKSILKVSSHNLVQKFDGVHYFPAYEYIIDILRDYSFFNEDGVHPNQKSIDEVYNLFLNHFLDSESIEYVSEWFDLKKLLNHKTLHPFSLTNIEFEYKLSLKKQAFISKYGVNL
jgi:hypothetical protein